MQNPDLKPVPASDTFFVSDAGTGLSVFGFKWEYLRHATHSRMDPDLVLLQDLQNTISVHAFFEAESKKNAKLIRTEVKAWQSSAFIVYGVPDNQSVACPGCADYWNTSLDNHFQMITPDTAAQSGSCTCKNDPTCMGSREIQEILRCIRIKMNDVDSRKL